jgi:3-methyl-2-oxobutanoate hydroxymethyltransferase
MSEKEESERSKHSKAEKPSGEGEKVSPPKPKRPRTIRARQSNKPKSPETNSLNKEKARGALVEIEPTTSFIMGLKGKRPIVGLTAYDTILGAAVSSSNVDFILVGDSLGTTLLGYDTTIPVTMEDMLRHTAAVRRANPQCLLVADLPFGEASLSFDRLLESARKLMQLGGADAVKIEGGRDVADDIEKLVATGIPVLGHIGLLPQTVKAIGGYRKFGETKEEAESIYTDAITLEEAGCFAIIAEMVDEKVASELARQILPPLIGIGCGDGCDGQILVTTDLLGWSHGPVPKFVKSYANLNKVVADALGKYVRDVRLGNLKK